MTRKTRPLLPLATCLVLSWCAALPAHAFDACDAETIMAQEPNCPPDPSVPCRILSVVRVPAFSFCLFDFGRRPLEIGSPEAPGSITTQDRTFLRIVAGRLTVWPRGAIDGSGDRGANFEMLIDDSLEVRAVGNKRGSIDVSGALSGGTLDIEAGGAVEVDGTILANRGADNESDYGATIAIHAGGDLTISGDIAAEHAPTAEYRAYAGAITLDTWGSLSSTGHLSVDGNGAGRLRLWAGHQLVVGRIDAAGHSIPGKGGEIEIYGRRGVEIVGPIDLRSGLTVGDGDGQGGDLYVDAPLGSITLSGHVSADSRIVDTYAGMVSLEAGEDIDVTADAAISAINVQSEGISQSIYLRAGRDLRISGPLDLTASDAGELDLHAGRHLHIGAEVRAAGTLYDQYSSGGFVTVRAGEAGNGNVDVQAEIDANSGGCLYGSDEGRGGVISIEGCDVTVASGAAVRVCGQSPGTIRVRSRHQATIGGGLLAKRLGNPGPNGVIQIAHAPASPPAIEATAETTPLAVFPLPLCTDAQGATCLTPCVECGNGIVEFPETCDPGDTPGHCSGCSASCQAITCAASYSCYPDRSHACLDDVIVCQAESCEGYNCPWVRPDPSCPEILYPCPGDCDHSGDLAAPEIDRAARAINFCAGRATGCGTDVYHVATCTAADIDESGRLTAGELTRMVGNAMKPGNGCPAAAPD